MSWAGWVFLLCVMSAPVEARQVVYNTRDGETLESLAQSYYGRAELAASLRTHNSLGDELTRGSVIEIPLGDEHVVSAGEDWGTLAARYWGDWELARVMPALVEPADAPLEPGTRLVIPALIHHRVRPGENFAVLSRRSYGNADRALAIAELNGISDPDRIAVGQHLRLPVLGGIDPSGPAPVPAPPAPPTPVAAGPPPQAAPDLQPQPQPQGRARPRPVASSDLAQALADAIEAYHQGEFVDARSALEALRLPMLEAGTPEQQRALLEHLVRVHVAFDDAEPACRSLRALREQVGDDALDPELFSPKVLELGATCAPAPPASAPASR